MNKKVLPVSEIERNKRVKELMSKRQERKEQVPLKLTQEEMNEVKGYMSQGLTRDQAVETVLELRRFFNKREVTNQGLNNWNRGGFINDEKYKQPIKHRKY